MTIHATQRQRHRGSGRLQTSGVAPLSLLQLAPALCYMALFFGAPLLFLLLMSLYTFSNFDFLPTLTLANYQAVFEDEAFRTLWVRTIELSLISALAAVAVAYVLTYLMMFVFPRRQRFLYFLVLVCLFGGYLVRIYAWRTILGAEGVINGTLMNLRLIGTPMGWMLNGPFAEVVALVNFLVPLAVIPIFGAMQNVPPALLEAGRDLGSSRWDVSRRLVIPLATPGLRVAFVFTFMGAAGEYAIPALLGGGGAQFVGNQVQFQMYETLDWPLGTAMAVVLIASAVVIAVGVSSLFRLVR